jgi:hypothetical protein
MATVPQPHPLYDPSPDLPSSPTEPEIPVHDPDDQPIEPHAGLPPETVNLSEEDEDAQSQTVAADAAVVEESPFGLEGSVKVSSGSPEDDVEDLVDHMHSMVRSGRIDMDAFRGERSDDDEEGALGPGGEED